MKSLTKLDTQITEKKFRIFITLYVIAALIPRILGMFGREYRDFNFIWEICILTILGLMAIILYRANVTMKPKHLIVVGLFFVVQILMTAVLAVTTNELVFNMSNQLSALLYILIFFGVFNNLKIDSRTFYKLNKFLVIFILFACIYNIVANFESITTFLSLSSPYEYSLSSFFDNRNTFGLILAIGMAVIITNYRLTESRKARIAYGIAFIIFLVNLFLCLSRGGMLFIVLFALLYMGITKGIRGILRVSVVALGLFLGVVMTIGPDFITDNLIRADYGTTGRSEVQEFGLQYYMSNDIFVGSGFSAPASKLSDEFGFDSFHNVYITILTSGGLLLLSFYIILIALSLRNMRLIYNHNKRIAAALMAFLGAYLVYGLTESTLLLQSGSVRFILTLYIIFLPMYLANYYASNKVIKK